MEESINKVQGMSRPKTKLTDNDYSPRFSLSKQADSSQDISGTKFESRLTLNPDNREHKKTQLIYVQDGNSNKNLKIVGNVNDQLMSMCASISEHRRDIPMTRKKIGCISEQKFTKINKQEFGHNLRQNQMTFLTALSKRDRLR